MKTTKKNQVHEKISQYGLAALSDNELLTAIGSKKSLSDYFESYEFKAAKELIRRRETPENIKVNSSRSAAQNLSFIEDLDHEQFWCIYLNRRNTVLKTEFVNKGSATASVVNVQGLIRRALELNAQALIIAHNHPSGETKPSNEDVTLTKKIKECAKLFDIQLLDSMIITTNGNYFSFADEGII
jgi:DNA repair protein RadC